MGFDLKSLRIGVASSLVFIFCCANVHSLEVLLNIAPSCANLVTFSQFCFICFEGLIRYKFLSVPSVVPVRNYMKLVMFYFVVSTLNNFVLTLDIPMPLHMVFRSGSLPSSMMLGMIFLNRKYSLKKYVSIIMVTLGIFISTYFSASQKASAPVLGTTVSKYTLGVSIMSVSLFMGSYMGILQENLSKQFGKHPGEMLFYTHFLAMPCFITVLPNVLNQIRIFSSIDTKFELLSGISISAAWFWLAINVLTQYCCVRSVYVLTTECTSLTVTLVTTVRRFISLVWSIYRFKNPFTPFHVVGSSLVLLGSFLYIDYTTDPKPKKE